jgi:hypothetical protein
MVMNSRTLPQRINHLLTQLMLLSDVPGTDPSRDPVSTGKGGHGTHKTRGGAPAGVFTPMHDRPLVVQYVDRLERLCEAMEADVATVKHGSTNRPAADKRSAGKRRDDRQILGEEGRDPTWVAFVYGRTTEGVRKLRQRADLDPDTGEAVRRAHLLTSREVS